MGEFQPLLLRLPLLTRWATRRASSEREPQVPYQFYRHLLTKSGDQRLFIRPGEGEVYSRAFFDSYVKYFNGGSDEGARKHFSFLQTLPQDFILAGILEPDYALVELEQDSTLSVRRGQMYDPYGRPMNGHVALMRRIPGIVNDASVEPATP